LGRTWLPTLEHSTPEMRCGQSCCFASESDSCACVFFIILLHLMVDALWL
jgi:hypothetical protein